MSRLTNFINGNRFAGLEAEMLSDGIRLRLVILKRKGQQVFIEKSVAVESLDDLSKQLPKDIPIRLALTGKGILHRRIAADPAADSRSFLAKALPNASPNDFYMQVAPASRDELWISLVRKNTADEILTQLNEKQFSVLSISLGTTALVHILPLLDQEKTEINCGNHFIQFEDGKISELQYVENENRFADFPIGGQNLENEMLPAFSFAFQQLIPLEKRIQAETEILIHSEADFFQKRLFKTGSLALLLSALLILLVNFLYFSSYREKRNELEGKVQIDGGALHEVNSLENQVKARRDFLEQAGLLHKSHYAFLADQLAAELPEEIQLTKMNFSPRLKFAEEDTIGFRPGEIEIAGRCSQTVVLNQWIQEMKNKNWIRSANLKSYVQDKSMLQGAFELKLETE